MSWGGIAKAAGVPVSRIRTWALHGGRLDHEALSNIEQLDGWLMCALEVGSSEPVYALESRLVKGYTATGWDLYCNGEAEALLRIVAGEDPARVLDDAFVDWRTRFDTAFEVFEAEDGCPAIRVKAGYHAPGGY